MLNLSLQRVIVRDVRQRIGSGEFSVWMTRPSFLPIILLIRGTLLLNLSSVSQKGQPLTVRSIPIATMVVVLHLDPTAVNNITHVPRRVAALPECQFATGQYECGDPEFCACETPAGNTGQLLLEAINMFALCPMYLFLQLQFLIQKRGYSEAISNSCRLNYNRATLYVLLF